MKKQIQRLDEDFLTSVYPIKDLVEGWFFRVQEVSNGVYEVEGTDSWGRKVSRKGTEAELDNVLKACANDARQIIESLRNE